MSAETSAKYLNDRGFLFDIRNPMAGWFEVSVPVNQHGEFIVQCGASLDDIMDRAAISAQYATPYSRPTRTQERPEPASEIGRDEGEHVLKEL